MSAVRKQPAGPVSVVASGYATGASAIAHAGGAGTSSVGDAHIRKYTDAAQRPDSEKRRRGSYLQQEQVKVHG